MPALQTLTLQDRAATPVTHTFVPRDIVNGVGTVVEYTGVPVGEATLTLSMKKSSDKARGRLVLKRPVIQTQTINGISSPVVVRTAYGQIDLTFDMGSSEQERTDMLGMLQQALQTSKTFVNDAFVKLEGIY